MREEFGHGPHHKKAKCGFEQLLCVEFDVVFEVQGSIEENSISVRCVGDECPLDDVAVTE